MDETANQSQTYVYYRFPCGACVAMIRDDFRAWILQVCEDRKNDLKDDKGNPITLPTEVSQGMAIAVLGLIARSPERMTEIGEHKTLEAALAAAQEKLEAELKVNWEGELAGLVPEVEIVGKEDNDVEGIQSGVGATESTEEKVDG